MERRREGTRTPSMGSLPAPPCRQPKISARRRRRFYSIFNRLRIPRLSDPLLNSGGQSAGRRFRNPNLVPNPKRGSSAFLAGQLHHLDPSKKKKGKMGQTLSEPVTAKESTSVQSSAYKVGSSCMQGWRVTMEDSHTHILALPDDEEAAFFAVYDGHGGPKVAQHAGHHLHKFIVQRDEYGEGKFPESLRKGFLEFDQSMLVDEAMRDELAGTTAVTVLIKNDRLFCANVGDSRAVGCIKGKVEPLSLDHKPNNPEESNRISKAGGWVEYNRVNGNLALSRALGDFVFKRNTGLKAEEQMVTALPDIEERTINEDWEFIILACDGIWDVVTNEEAVEFVRRRLSQRHEPEIICEELMTNCLAPDCQMGGLGCDNMTVILVCFLHGKSYEEFCRKIGEEVGTSAASLNGNSEGDREESESEDEENREKKREESEEETHIQ